MIFNKISDSLPCAGETVVAAMRDGSYAILTINSYRDLFDDHRGNWNIKIEEVNAWAKLPNNPAGLVYGESIYGNS